MFQIMNTEMYNDDDNNKNICKNIKVIKQLSVAGSDAVAGR